MDYRGIENYSFNDVKLLEQALTHSSFVNEKKLSPKLCNERLEFLGDAVLELVISEYIFCTYPEMTEGEMTKLRANVVCEQSLAEAARKLGFGERLRMGKGEERTGGRKRGSILADCFEAVSGAIFTDGGFEAAKKFILKNLHDQITSSRENFMTSDYKTHLQEQIQKWSRSPLEYTVVEEKGPAHDKTFVVELIHEEKVLASGQGKSKKEAEQNCAQKALRKLETQK